MLSERVMEWTQQWEQEGFLRGVEEGSLQNKQSTARNMLVEGFAVDLITRLTGLSVAEVEALRPS